MSQNTDTEVKIDVNKQLPADGFSFFGLLFLLERTDFSEPWMELGFPTHFKETLLTALRKKPELHNQAMKHIANSILPGEDLTPLSPPPTPPSTIRFPLTKAAPRNKPFTPTVEPRRKHMPSFRSNPEQDWQFIGTCITLSDPLVRDLEMTSIDATLEEFVEAVGKEEVERFVQELYLVNHPPTEGYVYDWETWVQETTVSFYAASVAGAPALTLVHDRTETTYVWQKKLKSVE